jgi:putative tricarboxylic transport membrane protein
VKFNDAVFGVVLLVGAIALFLYARTLPDMPGQDYGPALFPSLLAVGFGLCGLLLVASGWRARAVHPAVELSEWARSGGHIADVGLVIGGVVLVIWLWDELGFVLAATLLGGGLITRFRGGHALSSFALALGAVLVIDWAFRRLLLVPLPLGPLAGFIW